MSELLKDLYKYKDFYDDEILSEISDSISTISEIILPYTDITEESVDIVTNFNERSSKCLITFNMQYIHDEDCIEMLENYLNFNKLPFDRTNGYDNIKYEINIFTNIYFMSDELSYCIKNIKSDGIIEYYNKLSLIDKLVLISYLLDYSDIRDKKIKSILKQIKETEFLSKLIKLSEFDFEKNYKELYIFDKKYGNGEYNMNINFINKDIGFYDDVAGVYIDSSMNRIKKD